MTVVASANTLLDLDLRMNRVSADNLVVYSQQIAGAMRSLRGLVDETLIFMNTEGVPSADLERSPVDVARVFRQLMQAECSRLQLDPDQCVQVEMGHSFPALGLLPERLFAQGLRHFLGFVLNEGQARQFVIREEPGLCIIEAQWTAKPHWLPEAYLTLPRPQSHLMNMPWTDLDMPFPLLMTKRVIRNFQGTLTLNRLVAQEGAGQFGLRLSVPVAWEAVC